MPKIEFSNKVKQINKLGENKYSLKFKTFSAKIEWVPFNRTPIKWNKNSTYYQILSRNVL